MKKLANLKYRLIAWIIGVIAYSAIVFIVADHSKRGIDKCTVLTYVFMMISLVLLLLSWFVGERKTVPGAINAVNPVSSAAMYLTYVSFILTFILYFINYVKFIFIIVVLFILIYGIFAIYIIIGLRQFELINDNPNKVPDITNVHQLASYLRTIFDMVTEPTTKTQIEELINLATVIDDMNDSDNEDIKAVDKSIFEYAGYLKRNITRSEYANAYNNINKLNELLNKRINLAK